ncbi:MAG: response regulator [Flavobacteriaceae bacterium]|jgi:signal transduction histidine kinase/CheY-like chemotaxis protein|nr:response regulator [Flavobacteriaceae bacterium]
MKHLIILFILYSVSLQSQNNITQNVVVDSTSYFIELANFHKKNNNYRSSMDNIQKAIDFAEKKGDLNDKANSYLFLGNLYFDLKRFGDALETYNKCISFYSLQKPTSNMAYAYYGIGLCYIEKVEYTKAESFFKKAEEIYEIMQIPETRELINLQKGIVYYAKGEHKLASSIFNTIIIKPDENDIYKTRPEALYYLGLIEIENNRLNLALNYLNKANELSLKNNNLELRSKVTKSISNLYERTLDYTKSFDFLKQHVSLRDSIKLMRNKRIGVEDFISFKETERLKIIEQMDKENKAQQKAAQFSKLISILSIALISILSLLSLSLYKNNIIRSQSNKLLKEKNRELETAKEKAEKASKARADFLSTVSHELRTPLNAINGITHILLEEKPKKSQLQYLTSLKFSGDYLLNFINDILEINRVESENIEIEQINVNIIQLLEDLKSSFNDLSYKNENTLRLEIDNTIPENLIGDPTKLSQIFINLINNALKFTKKGTVIVRAKTVHKDSNHVTIHFEIADTGIGIAKEKQESIFESFSQGSVEINRKYGGTGLGLAIVKRLIDLLGGEIRLKSTEGIGSVFFFDIEFKIGEQVYNEVQNNYSDEVFENKSVLIVEDNKINQMITKKMVENKGMRSEIIDNGEEAIEAVRNNQYDLVLMDVHLPGINGTEATEKIRKFNKSIPIIALTAISLNENREMLMSYGMNDVITKPFNPNNFYKAIASQFY